MPESPIPTTVSRGFVTSSEDCEHHTWPDRGHEFWLKATRVQTGGAFSLTEIRSAAGSTVGRHVHDREDEAFYVLEGEYHYTIAGEQLLAGPGSVVFIPRGAEHEFTVGESDARCLTIFAPGGSEEIFSEVAIAATNGRDTSEVFARLGAKHHTRFLP